MKAASILFVLLHSQLASAGLFSVFEYEDGSTNWQYLANTSGGLLIISLTYSLVRLISSQRRTKQYNRELEEARSLLEHRVQERTATLDESNRLLQESNRGLEAEIAEHRSTMERLRVSQGYVASILESMPSMLIGVTHDGTITQWNRRAQEISSLEAKAVLGNNLWEAYPVITVSPDQVEAAISGNRSINIKHSQRGEFYFDVTIYPLTDHPDTGAVIMIDDVTQQVLAEDKLIQRDRMSSMGEMAASMAHDIETPLQGIQRDIEQLQAMADGLAGEPGEAARQLLEDARARGSQSTAITNNLLEFSSARVGEKRVRDVTALIDNSIALAETMFSLPSGLCFTGIEITREYASDVPEIPCFAAELQQVFLSLLRHCFHALDHAADLGREPTIRVEASHFYDAVWLKIMHNGKGIEPQEQQYIFEPFFADDQHAFNGDYDAGRRLSFPYFIIAQQHRGQLAVTSDPDTGTTFHIQLPLE